MGAYGTGARSFTPGRHHRDISISRLLQRHSRRSSALVVFVVAAPPEAGVVAALGRAVEPLIHAPEAVQAARIGGIGVVDDAVLEHERAHARPLAHVGGDVGSGHRREGDRTRGGGVRLRVEHVAATLIIILDAAGALLRLGDRGVEIEVEVAAERRCPGKRPRQPPLIRLQLRQRRPRHRPEHHVMVGQVNSEAVESVRDRRARRTPRHVVGPEHEVVDEELRAPSEEVLERGVPFIGVEAVLLVDTDPGQRLAPPRQLVAAPRELLLLFQQREPRRQPRLTCRDHVFRHHSLPTGGLRRTVPNRPERLVVLAGWWSCRRLGPGLEWVGVTNLAGFEWTRGSRPQRAATANVIRHREYQPGYRALPFALPCRGGDRCSRSVTWRSRARPSAELRRTPSPCGLDVQEMQALQGDVTYTELRGPIPIPTTATATRRRTSRRRAAA